MTAGSGSAHEMPAASPPQSTGTAWAEQGSDAALSLTTDSHDDEFSSHDDDQRSSSDAQAAAIADSIGPTPPVLKSSDLDSVEAVSEKALGAVDSNDDVFGDDGDDEFGGFADSGTKAVPPRESTDDDDFGDFDDAPAAPPNAVDEGSDGFVAAQEKPGEDDEFGGFASVNNRGGTDDDEDFGDFDAGKGANDDEFDSFTAASPSADSNFTPVASQPTSALVPATVLDGNDMDALKAAVTDAMNLAFPPDVVELHPGAAVTDCPTLDQLLSQQVRLPGGPAAWSTGVWQAPDATLTWGWSGSHFQAGLIRALGLAGDDQDPSAAQSAARGPRRVQPPTASSAVPPSAALTPFDAPPVVVPVLDSFASPPSAPLTSNAPCSDEFGSFTSPSTVPHAPQMTRTSAGIGSSGGFDMTPSPSVVQSSGDEFGSFGGFDSAPSAPAGQSAADNFGSFGGFDSAPPAPTGAAPHPVSGPSVDFDLSQLVGTTSMLSAPAAPLGMSDTLASLEPVSAPTVSTPTSTDGWLAKLPDLSFVLNISLDRPAGMA